MRRRIAAICLTSALALTVSPLSWPANAASSPSDVDNLSAVAGAGPGEVTFSWESDGRSTDHFVLETGLTSFGVSSSSSLPRYGRGAKAFTIPGNARSWTMSAMDAAGAGAGLGSGNYLYYRMYAVDSKNNRGDVTSLQATIPAAVTANQNATGTNMRVATFNVRTVKKTKDKRNWLARVDDVAGEILATRAGVVLLQEISPGRADGKGGSTKKVGRQTTTLLDRLARQGGKAYNYKLTRTTSYLKSGLKRGTQGARILYDNKRYALLSSCPEKTGKKYYNAACSFALPILSSDSESHRRRGSYALLQNRATGQKFWAVSAHLDERHSDSRTYGPRYEALRGAQARYLVSFINRINTKNYPVVFGADLNTWQSDRMGYSGHDTFIANGFYDTFSANNRVNADYNTSNQFATKLYPSAHGFGPHLDAVLVKGGQGGPDLWVNKMENPDPDRPSDHNLVFADIRI